MMTRDQAKRARQLLEALEDVGFEIASPPEEREALAKQSPPPLHLLKQPMVKLLFEDKNDNLRTIGTIPVDVVIDALKATAARLRAELKELGLEIEHTADYIIKALTSS